MLTSFDVVPLVDIELVALVRVDPFMPLESKLDGRDEPGLWKRAMFPSMPSMIFFDVFLRAEGIIGLSSSQSLCPSACGRCLRRDSVGCQHWVSKIVQQTPGVIEPSTGSIASLMPNFQPL